MLAYIYKLDKLAFSCPVAWPEGFVVVVYFMLVYQDLPLSGRSNVQKSSRRFWPQLCLELAISL